MSASATRTKDDGRIKAWKRRSIPGTTIRPHAKILASMRMIFWLLSRSAPVPPLSRLSTRPGSRLRRDKVPRSVETETACGAQRRPLHVVAGRRNAGPRFLQDYLLSQYTANREHTKEMTSRGSRNHVQNAHLETRAASAAEGASSRGTC